VNHLASKSGTKSKEPARLGGAKGAGDKTIALDLKSALAHLRPGRDIGIRLEGVPDGLPLSAGRPAGDGVWLLTMADLDGLAITVPAGFRGQAPLSVVLVRNGPDGAGAEQLSSFGILLTPAGATSAFSGLEPEEPEGNFDSVSRLRTSVGKGRGKLQAKTIKRPLDFGGNEATHAFVAQRSTAHLEALFRGDLAYNDGMTSEASLDVDQRLALARQMWEGERAKLIARVAELEEQLHLTLQELNQARAGDGATSSVRAKLIDIVARLSDEHAAELAGIEKRLRQEAEEMLAAARAEWECTGGYASS